VSVGDQSVSQREFDRFVKTTDEAIAQLRHDFDEHEDAHEQRTERSWGRIIGLITAAAGVAVAWVGLLGLHR
jgi:hypothetical protein